MHLAHELDAMDLGGGFTGSNFGGDLFVEAAGNHPRKHLALTRRERCEPVRLWEVAARVTLAIDSGRMTAHSETGPLPNGHSPVP